MSHIINQIIIHIINHDINHISRPFNLDKVYILYFWDLTFILIIFGEFNTTIKHNPIITHKQEN